MTPHTSDSHTSAVVASAEIEARMEMPPGGVADVILLH
jgi:hypothetical protein